MVIGRLPFEARDPLEWVHCHRAPAPSPVQLVRDVPEAVANIILKLLAKTADDRYQSEGASDARGRRVSGRPASPTLRSRRRDGDLAAAPTLGFLGPVAKE